MIQRYLRIGKRGKAYQYNDQQKYRENIDFFQKDSGYEYQVYERYQGKRCNTYDFGFQSKIF